MTDYSNPVIDPQALTEGGIAAVVLAAGLSRRMGRPKMLLPWGQTTVIRWVVEVLENSGVEQILVVTGGASADVENEMKGSSARTILNPDYARVEMLASLQIGIRQLQDEIISDSKVISAALVVLGDQPQIKVAIVESIVEAYCQTQADLIVPSYKLRRGHPWLVSKHLWSEILSLSPDQNLRNFLNNHDQQIHYLNFDDPSILKDLDTPQDWENERPEE